MHGLRNPGRPNTRAREDAPVRRIPRTWVVLWIAFLVYVVFRMVEMAVWLIRAIT